MVSAGNGHLSFAVKCNVLSAGFDESKELSLAGPSSITFSKPLQGCGCPHSRAQGTCHTVLAKYLLQHTPTYVRSSAALEEQKKALCGGMGRQNLQEPRKTEAEREDRRLNLEARTQNLEATKQK